MMITCDVYFLPNFYLIKITIEAVLLKICNLYKVTLIKNLEKLYRIVSFLYRQDIDIIKFSNISKANVF